MVRRINVFAPRFRHAQSHRVFDRAAFAFIVTYERRKHRQPGRVARSPSRGTQRIRIEIELRAVGRLPSTRGQFCLPHFPDRTSSRRDNNGVAIATDIGHVHLPLLQSETAGIARPGFDRHVRRDRITTVRKSAAIEIRFVRIIEKRYGDARLIIRHEHVVHFVKRPQCLPTRRQIGFQLRNHRRRIRENRPPRDVFVPRIGNRENLHRRNDRVGLRCVEQCRRRHHRRRPKNPPFLINPLGLRRRGDHKAEND